MQQPAGKREREQGGGGEEDDSRWRGGGEAMGIITTTMIEETTMTMTMTASTEEALAAVADRDDAIGGDKALGSKTTIKNGRGEAGDGNRMLKRQQKR